MTADLHAWWPKVRAGGTIAGHDYRQTVPWLVGLTPAVHDFFGVTDAAHPAMPACWTMVKDRPLQDSGDIPGGRASVRAECQCRLGWSVDLPSGQF